LRINRQGGCTGAEMEKSAAGNSHFIAQAFDSLLLTENVAL
jgi:hypothetical protein